MADAAVSFRVPIVGRQSVSLVADQPLNPTASVIDQPIAAPLLPPYDSQVGAAVSGGQRMVVGLAQWETRRLAGPHASSTELCLAASHGNCQESANPDADMTLPGAAAPTGTTSAIFIAGTEAKGTRLVSHYSGTEAPMHARLIALSIPISTIPPAITSGAPLIATTVYRQHKVRLLVGRLGGTVREAKLDDSNGSVSNMVVSPDGTEVAFLERTVMGFRMAVVFADGSLHRFLNPSDGRAVFGTPVWSIDGTQLFFSTDGGTVAAPADGSTAPLLVGLRKTDRPLGIAQNGRTLSVVWMVDGGNNFQLGTEILDGTARRAVGRPGLGMGPISPDAKTIAVSHNLGRGSFTGTEIGLVDVTTGKYHGFKATQSNRAGVSGPDVIVYPIGWSPDGHYLYYNAHDTQANARSRIYRMTATGTDRTELTPAVGPGWSGDVSVQQMF